MKKFLIAAAAAFTVMLSGCGSTDVSADAPLSEIVNDMVSSVNNTDAEMVEVSADDSDKISFYYNVEEEWYSDFSAQVAGGGALADEIVIFKANSEEYVDDIKSGLEARLDSRKEDFHDYVPSEYDKLCECSVETKGDYVYLIVTIDNQAAVSALESHFE